MKLRIDVAGDHMTIDLDGSSPQMEGPVNCGFAQTISACRVAFKLLINPERPVDGGTFHTLDVKAPESSIFDAHEPAACQWYFTPLGLLIDLVVTALAPVMPDKVAAAHFGDSMVLFLAGKDPRHDDAGFLYVMPHAGGWGGFEGGDGQDGLINNVNGGFKDYPVEVFEVKFPALIREYGFRMDTGGPGRFRGGCGLVRRFEVEPDSYLYLWLDRSVTPAWGLFGGSDAVGPDVIVNAGRPDERRMLKVNAHPLAAGSVVDLLTGGGGGFGQPLERDPERVRIDVLDGYVSRDAAKRDYGVVLDDALRVDEMATRRLRSRSTVAAAVWACSLQTRRCACDHDDLQMRNWVGRERGGRESRAERGGVGGSDRSSWKLGQPKFLTLSYGPRGTGAENTAREYESPGCPTSGGRSRGSSAQFETDESFGLLSEVRHQVLRVSGFVVAVFNSGASTPSASPPR